MPRDVAPRTLPADPTEAMHAVTKQYCDANGGGSGVGIQWAESTTTAGVTKNGTTGVRLAEVARFTQQFYLPFPLKITGFHFDLPGEGTYRITLDTHAVNKDHNTRYPWFVIAEEVEITEAEAAVTFGANKEVIPDDGDFVLMQGAYFLTVEKTAEGMADHFDAYFSRRVQGFGDPNPVPYVYAPIATELWGASPDQRWLDDGDYGHSDLWSGYCLPMRITAYKGTWVL